MKGETTPVGFTAELLPGTELRIRIMPEGETPAARDAEYKYTVRRG